VRMACYCLSKKLFSVIIEYHYLLSFYTEIISQLSLPSLGMGRITGGGGIGEEGIDREKERACYT